MKRKREGEPAQWPPATRREGEESQETPEGSQSEGGESQLQEEEAGGQPFASWPSSYQESSPSPSGSQGFEFVPPGSMDLDVVETVQEAVSAHAVAFGEILEECTASFLGHVPDIDISQKRMSEMLGRTPGFEFVPVPDRSLLSRTEEEEEEVVFQTPDSTQEHMIETATQMRVGAEETEDEADEEVVEVTVDDDTGLYVGQAAGKIFDEAFKEYVDEVLQRAKSNSPHYEHYPMRLLRLEVLSDPGLTSVLDGMRSEVIDHLEGAILSLLDQEDMVEG